MVLFALGEIKARLLGGTQQGRNESLLDRRGPWLFISPLKQGLSTD
jgi:hypothetical protein